MQIRSKTLRRLLVLGSFIVAIIITVQLFWLQKIYLFEQKQFNINVSKSIKSMYEILQVQDTTSFEQRTENPQTDLYIARVGRLPDLNKVLPVISKELTDYDVFTDCKIGIYRAGSESYINEKYIDLPDANFKARKDAQIPVYKRSFDYIVLYFPNRTRYVIKQMIFWIVSGGLLLVVLIAFGVSIFYLYQQKFLNETQKEFVNNFTHEFKTPLSVIKIAADVLKDPAIIHKPEKLENYAGIIHDQTLHLQNQTDRLLQIAFTENKPISLRKELFDVAPLIQQAVDDLYPMIEATEGNIKIEHKSSTTIMADPSYIFLVIINLLENAIKYSVKPQIIITTFREANHLMILIRDNGIGIEKKYQKKIFHKFYRVTLGDVHHVNGFGLGLSFVKGIIEAHKGSIDVESEPGEGSEFRIKIPTV